MRALRYALDEALASLWRGRRSGALSTATIALALFVLGAFLIVVANLQQLGAEWSSAAEVSVYLRDDVTAAERQAVAGALRPGAGAAGPEFVSESHALARFKQEGRGFIVYLRDGTAGVPVAEIPHESTTGTEAARSQQWREIGLGAQILKDLGISSIRLLSSSKRTYVGLSGFGIEIEEFPAQIAQVALWLTDHQMNVHARS